MGSLQVNLSSQVSARAASPGSEVPIGATSRDALLSRFSFVREVPGYPGAFVVRGPMGEQLFADTRLLARPDRTTVLRSAWQAAFGKALRSDYKAVPAVEPGPQVAYLVVIAIIAILISLLVPAVQRVRNGTGGTATWPVLSVAVGSDLLDWANSLFH